MQDSFAFCWNEAADNLLCNILGAVAEQVLELLGIKLFNDFFLPLYDIRVLLREHVESAFVLEQHF